MPETIWVFLETERDEIKKISLEALTLARQLAGGAGRTVSAVMTGKIPAAAVATAARYGADSVYRCDNEEISAHDTDTHTAILAIIAGQTAPALLLLGATPLGGEIAPRLAARLKAALISQCVELKYEGENLAGRRAILNNKAHATVVCPPVPLHIATIAAGAFESKEIPQPAPVELKQIVLPGRPKPAVEFLEYIKGDPATINLTEAEAVIAIGKGLETADRLPLVQELAGLLGASLGGTRVAVDLKWLPLERQIGITGITVAPRLFVSCGISGQYPHTVGMDAAETVIVINKDREAPMFKLATLGITGPLETIIPALAARLKREIPARKDNA